MYDSSVTMIPLPSAPPRPPAFHTLKCFPSVNFLLDQSSEQTRGKELLHQESIPGPGSPPDSEEVLLFTQILTNANEQFSDAKESFSPAL